MHVCVCVCVCVHVCAFVCVRACACVYDWMKCMKMNECIDEEMSEMDEINENCTRV